MKQVVRVLPTIPAVIASVVLIGVVVNGASTVLNLREYGPSGYPLISALNIVPASFIALSFLTFAKGHRRVAATLGILALVVSCLFWIPQASGRLG